MSAETPREATDEQWADAIEDSQLILDDSLTPADIAAEFNDVARETMADLCREAVLQVEQDRSAVILEDFRAARDVLNDDDEDDEECTLSAGDSLEAMLGDVDGLADNIDSHPDEPNGETDAAPSTDSQSSLSNVDTGSPVEPGPSTMDRDALEDEVSDNRERIATLEAHVETLQEVANRDVAIMRGALQEGAVREHFDRIEKRLESVEQEVQGQREGGNGTDDLEAQVAALEEHLGTLEENQETLVDDLRKVVDFLEETREEVGLGGFWENDRA